jgi:hypothetical protein
MSHVGLAALAWLAIAPLPGVEAQDAPAKSAGVAPALSQEREQRLRARVASWHEARIIRDQRAMYDLLEPDYRTRVDFATYAQQTTVRLRFSLLKYEIAAIEPVSGDRVHVVVDLRIDLGRFGENVTPATDTWVWREGDWWLVFKEAELPFPK